MRVSIHEEGPTVFVTLDNATEAPPCCVHNDTDRDIYFQAQLQEGSYFGAAPPGPGRPGGAP